MKKPISKKTESTYHKIEQITGKDISANILKLILADNPSFRLEDAISIETLNKYRRIYLSKTLEEQIDDKAFYLEIKNALENNNLVSKNSDDESQNTFTIGQKLADTIAKFGGSWSFIIIFFSFIVIWMVLNTWIWTSNQVDPYPFILLNLILSCLAAIQAPIIMMSQNRQEQKDRIRAEMDYKINLKAELEIRLLSEKIDQYLIHQNKKLLEIQEIHFEYIEDLVKQIATTKK